MSELDDLDAIESSGAQRNELEISNIYNVTIGGFGGDTGLKTYLASVRVSELEQDISFYEKLTKDKSWPVSQIVQRQVERIRVSNIAKDYILRSGRVVKYFPPIIVAILPRDEEGKIDLKVKFNNEISSETKDLIFEKSIYRNNEALKKYFDNSTNSSVAENLYILNILKTFDINIMCWDKSKYYAIVIDGQHRLAALLKSKEEKSEIGEYKQDVVFVDFTELLKENETRTPIEVVRRIFIDINTNAKRVDFVRQILMDDKDLSSIIVQSLVDSVYPDGQSKPQENYISSEIVDWYGRGLKHKLPHLTGVLTLYQIIRDYLVQNSLNDIDDYRSQNKVKKWVKSMNETFFVDQLINDDTTSLDDSLDTYLRTNEINNELQSEVDDENKESELFVYDYAILDIAVKRFNDVYVQSFVKIFNEFAPYKKAFDLIKEQDGNSKDSDLGKALLASPSKIQSSSLLKTALGDIRAKLKRELDQNYQLTYSVLFQKVMFSNLIKEIIKNNTKEFTNEECLEVTNSYLENLNNLLKRCESSEFSLFGLKDSNIIEDIPEALDYGMLSKNFWEGLIYENGNIIYNSQGIKTFSAMLAILMDCEKNVSSDGYVVKNIDSVPYARSRVKRILKNNHGIVEDELLETKASEILDLKYNYIKKYFNIN